MSISHAMRALLLFSIKKFACPGISRATNKVRGVELLHGRVRGYGLMLIAGRVWIGGGKEYAGSRERE